MSWLFTSFIHLTEALDYSFLSHRQYKFQKKSIPYNSNKKNACMHMDLLNKAPPKKRDFVPALCGHETPFFPASFLSLLFFSYCKSAGNRERNPNGRISHIFLGPGPFHLLEPSLWHRPQKSFSSLFLSFLSYRHNNKSIQLANFFNAQLCLKTFFGGERVPTRLSMWLSYIKSDGLSLGLSPNHSTIFPSCAWLEFWLVPSPELITFLTLGDRSGNKSHNIFFAGAEKEGE